MEAKLFEKLYSVDVSEHVEVKDNGSVKLSYLSWAYAWYHFKLECPDATYQIKMFTDISGESKPYLVDKYGIMVFTSVTANGMTYEMWLPVMDGQNRAMKDEPYDYETKSGVKHVEAASMFDINKTIMRCLVKNIAMFGLGLSIYAGEDLPEVSSDKVVSQPKPQPTKDLNLASESQKKFMWDLINQKGKSAESIKQLYKIDVHGVITKQQANSLIEYLKKLPDVPKGNINPKDIKVADTYEDYDPYEHLEGN